MVWAGPLGYRDPALYSAFWKIVEHYRIAAMSAVPTVYATLAAVPVDADISSLRYAMVGAVPLPAAVRDGFQAHTGVPLLEGYGLTEATCASARSFPDAPRARLGRAATALPAGQGGARRRRRRHLARPARPAQDRRAGDQRPDGLPRLRRRPRRPTATCSTASANCVDGWLDTGDLGQVDEDGFVHLTGRAKDLIIRGGHNIDPAIVEDALLTHPDVTGGQRPSADPTGTPERCPSPTSPSPRAPP